MRLNSLVQFINSWFDPPAERKAAEALVADGVDVLGQVGIDSPSTGDAAKAAGIPWTGYNRSQADKTPIHAASGFPIPTRSRATIRQQGQKATPGRVRRNRWAMPRS